MCTPAFPETVSFTCVFEFIKNVKSGKDVLSLIEQGLWLSGSIVKTFQVKPISIAMALSEDVNLNIDLLCSHLKSFFPENDSVALSLPWGEILTCVLKLVELIAKSI